MTKFKATGASTRWGSFFRDEEEENSDELIHPRLGYMEKYDLKKALKRNDPELEQAMEMLPEHVQNDIYSLYYNPSHEVKLGNVTDENRWYYELIRRVNNYYLKTVTEHNTMNSFIVTKEYMRMLHNLCKSKQQQQPNGKQSEKEKEDNLQKAADCNQKEFDQALQQANQKIEQTMQQAKENQDIAEMAQSERNNSNNGSDQKAQGCSKGESNTGFDECANVLEILKYLKNITLSQKNIQEFVKKSLKLSASYFSSKYTMTEEEFMEADEISDLHGLEYLVPMLRNLSLSDITTDIRKHHLNFDIYIDRSGSMDSHVRIGSGSISGYDLCKITALKITAMGYGKDIYVFDDQVKKVEGVKKILGTGTGGGTRTERVISNIIKTGRPGLILTDMCDTITEYTDKAFFIGILGANFGGLQGDGKKYLSNKQVMKFVNDKFVKA